MENSQKNYIDIGDLSDLLANKRWHFDKHQMQIFEEIVYLCINDSFIKDVQKIRSYFIKKYSNIAIPTNNTYKAEAVVRFLYIKHHKKYKKLVEELIKKYKLIPWLYWEDKLRFINMYIEDELKERDHFDRKISKSEARFNAIEEKLEDYPLNLMDNIILRNSPFQRDDAFPFWNNPYFTRKPMAGLSMPMSIVRKHQAIINIGFPAYSSLSEMIELLKKNFKKIQEYRATELPVPAKKDYRKSELKKSIYAYMMYIKGEKIERIAIELDKKYGGEHTFESIIKIVERMKKDSERFDKYEKQAKIQETTPY